MDKSLKGEFEEMICCEKCRYSIKSQLDRSKLMEEYNSILRKREELKPEKFWIFFTDNFTYDCDRAILSSKLTNLAETIRIHDEDVMCKRFPKPVLKKKTDHCGEYSD